MKKKVETVGYYNYDFLTLVKETLDPDSLVLFLLFQFELDLQYKKEWDVYYNDPFGFTQAEYEETYDKFYMSLIEMYEVLLEIQ
jgi:hypothetical protein